MAIYLRSAGRISASVSAVTMSCATGVLIYPLWLEKRSFPSLMLCRNKGSLVGPGKTSNASILLASRESLLQRQKLISIEPVHRHSLLQAEVLAEVVLCSFPVLLGHPADWFSFAIVSKDLNLLSSSALKFKKAAHMLFEAPPPPSDFPSKSLGSFMFRSVRVITPVGFLDYYRLTPQGLVL